MSTQEKVVPKRRSSRGSTAKSRSGAARRKANVAPEMASTAGASTAQAVETTASVKASASSVAGKKERAQKDAPPKRSLLSTDRFDGVKRFSRETYAEIKKVNWPDQQTTRNLTVVVIAVSAALGILLGGIDFALLKIFEAMP